MARKRIYYIGNTHIDHTWLWNWTEGYDEAKAAFQAVLDRMEEFPEFRFTCSSTLLYEWVEKNEPELFERIVEKVREGRWQLVGGWAVQSDNNIPSGESFCRQGLYGQRYFASRFGKRAKVGYCVDSFGHNAQLPQFLRLQGMNGWLHFRPNQAELELPDGPYRWTGIDGSQVVGCRPDGWYCSHRPDWFNTIGEALLPNMEKLPNALFFYGVGDHGGGPTIRDLEMLRDFREAHPEYEHVYGDIDEFYRRADGRELPEVRGELQYCFRGCYTSNSSIKSLNRRCEGRLGMAEWASSLAAMTGKGEYPEEELRQAWQDVLANQFHDVMCGTCTPHAMEEAVFRYAGVMETADRLRHFGSKKLTDRFDGRAPRGYSESLAVTVLNSASWERQEGVEFFAHTPGRSIDHGAVVDGKGKPVDFQKVRSPFGGPDNRGTYLIEPTVPAGGAALFHVVENPEPPSPRTDLRATRTGLENSLWRLRVDGNTGAIRSLFDKKKGVELVRRGKRLDDLLVIHDDSDTWGTGRERFDEVVGRFEGAQVRLLERGPLRARLEIRRRYELCTAYETISLHRKSGRVDFELSVIWNDALKTVKIAFPLALERARSLYEIPYGTLERKADGGENPVQKWVMVKGKARARGKSGLMNYSVGVAVDTIGGADVQADGELRLTLLRSPNHGHLTGQAIETSPDRQIVDQGGPRRARYSLVAGSGDLGLPELGVALSQPLQVTFEGAQPGNTVVPFSLLSCAPTSVHVGAIKRAEDGRGFIVRLVETRGKKSEAKVKGPKGFKAIRTALKPYEIQSWRWVVGKAPVAVDLVEYAVGKGK